MLRQESSFARRGRTGFWLARLAALASIGSLALVALAHVSMLPRLAAFADMFTPITGHFIIGAVGAWAAVRIGRHELAILATAVAFAVGGHTAWALQHQPVVLWPAGPLDPPRHTLRVYFLNTWDKNPDLDGLEHAVEVVDADVMVLAEVDRRKLSMLERLKRRFPYQMSCAEHTECATAVLSRFPIVAGAAVRDRYDVPPIAWARIDASAIGVGELTVIGTHVHRPTRSPWLHVRHMQALATLVASVKGPLIVAGDFNAGFWTASFTRFEQATGLTPTGHLLPTWPAFPLVLPQFAFDQILLSRDFAAVRSGVGPATGSDHLPVFAEVAVRQPAAN